MAKQFNLKKVLSPVADVVRKLKTRRDYLMEEVDLIESELSRLVGAKRGRKPAVDHEPTEPKVRKGKRIRRSREELEAAAADIVKFIGDSGKEGVNAKEITGRFGVLLPSPNAWLKMYSKTKIKTMGKKSKMRYHL